MPGQDAQAGCCEKYRAQNEAYKEVDGEKRRKALPVKELCVMAASGHAKRNVYMGLHGVYFLGGSTGERLAESLHLKAVWFAYGLFYCLCGKTLYMRAFSANMGLI